MPSVYDAPDQHTVSAIAAPASSYFSKYVLSGHLALFQLSLRRNDLSETQRDELQEALRVLDIRERIAYRANKLFRAVSDPDAVRQEGQWYIADLAPEIRAAREELSNLLTEHRIDPITLSSSFGGVPFQSLSPEEQEKATLPENQLRTRQRLSR